MALQPAWPAPLEAKTSAYFAVGGYGPYGYTPTALITDVAVYDLDGFSAGAYDAKLASIAGHYSATGSEVPEPGALTLLVAGLSGLLAYAWRKRK